MHDHSGPGCGSLDAIAGDQVAGVEPDPVVIATIVILAVLPGEHGNLAPGGSQSLDDQSSKPARAAGDKDGRCHRVLLTSWLAAGPCKADGADAAGARGVSHCSDESERTDVTAARLRHRHLAEKGPVVLRDRHVYYPGRTGQVARQRPLRLLEMLGLHMGHAGVSVLEGLDQDILARVVQASRPVEPQAARLGPGRLGEVTGDLRPPICVLGPHREFRRYENHRSPLVVPAPCSSHPRRTRYMTSYRSPFGATISRRRIIGAGL